MFRLLPIALICFTAAGVSLRADDACVAPTVSGINLCGDEGSRLSRIGGIEDVELNLLASGRSDFQAFFKPGSYVPPDSDSHASTARQESTSDDGSVQFDWGGGGDGNSGQPANLPAFFDDPPVNTHPSSAEELLNKILAPNGGIPSSTMTDPPDPTPEPVYSALLVLGAGLMVFVGRKNRTALRGPEQN